MLSAAILGTATVAGAATKDPLEPLRWKSRVLLVFAQGDRDREHAQQQALPVDGLKERDLVVLRIPYSGEVAVPGIGAMTSASIRTAYGVGEDTPFTVLLIGKDGDVKQRSSEPITARDLFATIDAMPMRQQEMR